MVRTFESLTFFHHPAQVDLCDQIPKCKYYEVWKAVGSCCPSNSFFSSIDNFHRVRRVSMFVVGRWWCEMWNGRQHSTQRSTDWKPFQKIKQAKAISSFEEWMNNRKLMRCLNGQLHGYSKIWTMDVRLAIENRSGGCLICSLESHPPTANKCQNNDLKKASLPGWGVSGTVLVQWYTVLRFKKTEASSTS